MFKKVEMKPLCGLSVQTQCKTESSNPAYFAIGHYRRRGQRETPHIGLLPKGKSESLLLGPAMLGNEYAVLQNGIHA